ncbi:unnamed protein product [Symbiodinium sp. CCMP2592]|nr:unnamed protein product [Symbiodinium sp. CCMP2592]
MPPPTPICRIKKKKSQWSLSLVEIPPSNSQTGPLFGRALYAEAPASADGSDSGADSSQWLVRQSRDTQQIQASSHAFAIIALEGSSRGATLAAVAAAMGCKPEPCGDNSGVLCQLQDVHPLIVHPVQNTQGCTEPCSQRG